MINYLNLIKNVNDEITNREPFQNKYTDELRASLIEKAKVIGDLKKAAKKLDVPHSTLYRWINRG